MARNNGKANRVRRAKGTAVNVHQIVNSLKERKVLIVSNSAVTISTLGTVINLSNNCVQGDSFNQRSGNTIRALKQSLIFRFFGITNNQSARVILFRDNQNNGSTPAVLDVLDQSIFQSPYNSLTVYQQKRFTILWDKVIDVSISGEDVKTLETSIGETGNIYYNGATAVAASNGKGALFLLVVGDNITGRYDYGWEVTYTDD